MNEHNTTPTRPPIETLACINHGCELYGQKGQGNLTVRKTYGKDEIRFVRCGCCGAEFSERKGTALWNTKVSESRAVAVAEHLAEGCSLKATSRLAEVDVSVVRRLNRKVGEQGAAFHDERVQNLRVKALEGDERHGYAHDKGQPQWEAELIDPESKFVVAHVQGRRDEALIRRLLEDGASRLANRHELVLLTDGDASYAALFPEIFGKPIVRLGRAAGDASPTCAIVSLAPWLMSRLSSTARVTGSLTPKSAIPMALAPSSSRCSTTWAMPSPIPRPLSGAMAPLAA